MFIDASALTGIMANESDAEVLRKKLRAGKRLHVSGIVIYEAVLALLRIKAKSRAEALHEVNAFIELNEIKCIDIGQDLSELALEAFDRFGKGRHPARLNMGDCYSYACAKHLKLPLLFKGEDFSKTDILKA
jgi:ribonuclease VapC